jgi:hypothetical protein
MLMWGGGEGGGGRTVHHNVVYRRKMEVEDDFESRLLTQVHQFRIFRTIPEYSDLVLRIDL